MGLEAGFSEEIWARGMSHLVTVAELYNSKLERLKELTQPSLLIEGIDDLATDPVSVDAHRNDVLGRAGGHLRAVGAFPAFRGSRSGTPNWSAPSSTPTG